MGEHVADLEYGPLRNYADVQSARHHEVAADRSAQPPREPLDLLLVVLGANAEVVPDPVGDARRQADLQVPGALPGSGRLTLSGEQNTRLGCGQPGSVGQDGRSKEQPRLSATGTGRSRRVAAHRRGLSKCC